MEASELETSFDAASCNSDARKETGRINDDAQDRNFGGSEETGSSSSLIRYSNRDFHRDVRGRNDYSKFNDELTLHDET